jgi:hypothetical protein
MQQNNPTNFSESDLDRLLNRSFLELDQKDPKNAKMMEVIAAQTFAEKPLLRKLADRIALRVLIFSCAAFLIGTVGLIVIKNNSSEPKNTDSVSHTVQQKITLMPESKTEMESKQNVNQKTPAASNVNMYKKSPESVNTTAWQTYNDSTNGVPITQMPEPIYFNDPALVLLKNDSIQSNPKPAEKHNEQIKRKPKSKWREHEVK